MIRLPHLLLLVVGSQAASLNLRQHFTEEPSDITATTGDKVRFSCRVENRQGSCQWTQNGFGLGTDEELLGFSRYSYDMSDGRCDLLIEPVLVEDEGEYQCQAGAVSGVAAIKSVPAQLRVYQEPGRPHILQTKLGDVMEVVESQVVQLECDTQGGKPAADIIWRHGDGSRLESEVVDMISRMDDRKLFRTKSVLKFVPDRNEQIYCEAVSEVFRVPLKSPEIKIRLKNSPRANLKFSKEVVQVGENIQVDCEVEGTKKILQYHWSLDNNELPEEKMKVLRLENVQAGNDKMKIGCRVETESGASLQAEGRLAVSRQLAVTQHPANLTVAAGQSFSLQCGAEGAEDVEYVWTRDQRLVGMGPSLTLLGGAETAGEYICTAVANTNQPVSSRPGRVTLRRRPTLPQQRGTVYARIGATSRLSCRLENYHNGTTVGWKLEDRIISSDNVKHKIINLQNSSFLNTNLVIMDTEEKDFGTYICFADTSERTLEREVELRSENNYYFIMSLIGGLIVIFSLCFFLFIFLRKRLRNNSVQFMENQKEILKTEDKTVIERLLLKNDNFKIDQEFNCDDLINESTGLNLKKAKRLNRFYSAPNGSFASDNTVISYVHD